MKAWATGGSSQRPLMPAWNWPNALTSRIGLRGALGLGGVDEGRLVRAQPEGGVPEAVGPGAVAVQA